MSLARLRCISMVTSKDGKQISKQAPMTKKGARNNDASSIKVFGTKCEAIVYEYTGYKGWKATFKTGVYPFNAHYDYAPPSRSIQPEDASQEHPLAISLLELSSAKVHRTW